MEINLPDERLKPLLYRLEATIHDHYRRAPRLRDVDVIEALHEVQRSLKGGGTPPRDPLARALHEALGSTEGAYGPNDWAVALRLLVASAKRHRRVDGPRGYLDFISVYAPLSGQTQE